MTIRVAVNLLWLRPGVVGGSEDLVCGYLKALADRSEVELTLFVVGGFSEAHPDLVDRYETVEAPRICGSRVGRVLVEATWLRRRTAGFDAVHHAGGTVPNRSRVPTIVTVHDLQPLDRPDSFGSVKRRWLAWLLPRSIGVADAVHVTSTFVAQGIRNRFPADAAKVMVVPPVVAPASGSGSDADELARSDRARLVRLEVTPPFVLYPAIAYSHKNHSTLIDAVAEARRAHPGLELVLCGGDGPNDEAVQERLAPLDRRLGRVVRADLEALLRSAAVMAFPSRYEGFGLPVAEAMRAGTPVVAADATALTDVVGQAGTLVDPDDVSGWADAIGAILDDPARAARLAAAGRERARMFDAEPVADRIVALYERVTGS